MGEFFELSMHAEKRRENEKVKGYGSTEVKQSQHTLLLPPVVFAIIRGWKKKRTRSKSGNVTVNIGFFFPDEEAGINNDMKEKSFTRKILLEICISFLKESWKHTVSTHTQRVRVCVQTLENTHRQTSRYK